MPQESDFVWAIPILCGALPMNNRKEWLIKNQ
jgi:hypothetical protein